MLKDITLGQYFPGDTVAHRLDPRTKILLVTLYIIALFCAKSIVTYALLALVLALTLVTNIIVQVLKSLLYDMLPTNLLAFLVAAVVTVGAGFGLWSYYRFAITGWMIVALIALIFLVAFSAMFGYDKLVQLMEQAGWIKAQK